jgi:exodeoxyribonuclease VII small subunit
MKSKKGGRVTEETTERFEEVFERLQRSIDELETGPLPLEDAIARYEEGVRLARLCNEILDQAELRMQHVLRESENGSGAR